MTDTEKLIDTAGKVVMLGMALKVVDKIIPKMKPVKFKQKYSRKSKW